MSRRKKLKKIYTYKCSLSNLSYKTTREAPNPSDLLSVDAFYELNPEKDKRPEGEKIKRKQAFEERKAKLNLEEEAAAEEILEEDEEEIEE